MRVLIVPMFVAGGAVHATTMSGKQVPTPTERLAGLIQRVQGFDCADVSCKRLGSCDEACHKLLVCGQRVRDGDNDGIPCENLCSRPC